MPERGQPKRKPSKEAEEMAQVEADFENYENLSELSEELTEGQELLKNLSDKYDEFPKPQFVEETSGPLGEQHAKRLLNRDEIDESLNLLDEEEQNELHEYFRAAAELEDLEEGSESVGTGRDELRDAKGKAQEQQSDTIT